MFDRDIWNQINEKKICSFKVHSTTTVLCKNKYNVTGLCEEFSCPLANSTYSTVREKDGLLYLYKKIKANRYLPNQQYEEIKLPLDGPKGLIEIENELKNFSEEYIHKCKQKYIKLLNYLIRKDNIKLTVRPRLASKFKKEKRRAKEAFKKIDSTCKIRQELLKRLHMGIYGKEEIEEAEKIDHKNKKRKYIAEFEESDEITRVIKKEKEKEEEKIIW